jgi:hypothetical protein
MIQAARWGRVLAAAFCLCGILLVQGCSGGMGTVSGKVTFLGKPVRGGTVSFIPEAGSVVIAQIEEDGSYTVRNVTPGKAKITVDTSSFRPQAQKAPPGVSPQFAKEMMEKMNPDFADAGRAKRYVAIPPQYTDPDQTKLSYEVKSGKQQHDIDMQ